MGQDFYDWLNSELEQRGWTKRDLAARSLDLTEGSVYAVLSPGRFRDPSAMFCVHIAKALGLPTNEVLRRAGFSTVPDPPDVDDPDLADAWRVLQELSPEARRWALAALRGLRDGESGKG